MPHNLKNLLCFSPGNDVDNFKYAVSHPSPVFHILKSSKSILILVPAGLSIVQEHWVWNCVLLYNFYIIWLKNVDKKSSTKMMTKQKSHLRIKSLWIIRTFQHLLTATAQPKNNFSHDVSKVKFKEDGHWSGDTNFLQQNKKWLFRKSAWYKRRKMAGPDSGNSKEHVDFLVKCMCRITKLIIRL